MNVAESRQSIVYQARLNKIIFFWPIILAVAAFFLAYYYSVAQQPAVIIILVAIAWFFMTWITYLFSSLTVKSRRIILRTGILVRQTVDIPLDKIESIDIRQSLFGSLLKYGTLVITGTGGTRHMIAYINQPLTCRRYIEQLMHQED